MSNCTATSYHSSMKAWKLESYDHLPALSVHGAQLRSSLRTITVAWMFGIVWLIAISGSHFKVIAERLGFGDFSFGLLATLPYVATIGQVFAAMIIERTGVVKYQFINCGLASRALWLIVAGIPLLLPIPSYVAIALTLLVITTSWFLQALAVPAWLTWMGVLVPRRLRGRYFAHRDRAAMGVQIVVALIFGLAIDWIDPNWPNAEQMQLWIGCGIVAFGALCGIVDVFAFRRIPEVLPQHKPAPTSGDPSDAQDRSAPPLPGSSIFEFVLGPLRDRTFRSYVLYSATLTFSMTVGAWFYWLNALDNLGFSNLGVNAMFLAVTPLAGMWAIRQWGKAIDRWGRKPVLILCTIGAAVTVVPWLLLTPGLTTPAFLSNSLVWIASTAGGWVGQPDWGQTVAAAPVMAYVVALAACALGGMVWVGINLAQTGIVLGFADGSGQSRYVAASSLLIGVGGILGGLAGGWIAHATDFLQEDPIQLGPFLWNNWHLTFAIALVARIVAIRWLIGMPEPGAIRARSLAKYMSVNAYNGIISRLFYPLRVLGWQQSVRPSGSTEPPKAP